MQVILVNDVEKLGRAGDVVNVAPGYARNYLLPKKIAYDASPKNMKWIERQKEKILERAAALRTDAESLAARIESVKIVVAKQAGEEDKLYGAVTSAEIAEKFKEHGIEVEKRKILLAEPIKRLGEHTVTVRVHADISATVSVNVVRSGEESTETAEG